MRFNATPVKLILKPSCAVLSFLMFLGCKPDTSQCPQGTVNSSSNDASGAQQAVPKRVSDTPTDEDVLNAGQTLAAATKFVVNYDGKKDLSESFSALSATNIRRSKEPFGDSLYRVEFELTIRLPHGFEYSKGLVWRDLELEARSPSLNRFMETIGLENTPRNSSSIPTLLWKKDWHELHSRAGMGRIKFQIKIILRKWDDGWRLERLLR